MEEDRAMTGPRRHAPRWPAVLVALTLALGSACAGTGSSTDEGTGTAEAAEPVAGGTIVFALSAETAGWSPAGDAWLSSGYNVARAVFDPLTAYDADGAIRPFLAESIDANDDFTEWTIGLRAGVRFHDGTDLDAAALQTHLEQMVASPIWSHFFEPVTEIATADAMTVTIRTSEPYSTLPHLLSLQPGYVAAPAQYAAGADGPLEPIGTGPFVFENWVMDSTLEVGRNDDYWRGEPARLDSIEFRVITDPIARLDSLEAGDVDLIEVADADTIVALDDSDELTLHLEDRAEGTERSLALNAGAEPFDNPNARLAVAHAIDREQLSAIVFDDRFPAANGPFQPDSPWYQDVEFPRYDVEEAKRYAQRYEDETGRPLAFTLRGLPDSTTGEVSQLIQTMLAEAGIEMTIDPVESTQLLVGSVTGEYQANAVEQLFGSQHPDREYPILHSSDGEGIQVNVTRLDDAELDAALDESRRTDVPDEQIAAWKTVQERLAAQNTIIFLVHQERGVAANGDVGGLDDPTFPDGEPLLAQEQTVIWTYQLWTSAG